MRFAVLLGLATSLLAVAAAAAPPPPSELEARALRAVALSFERVGRRTPMADDALNAASRRLAEVALMDGAQAAADLVTLTEAVSSAGGWDASPRALVVRGSPRTSPLKSLEERRDLSDEAASHLGVGVAVRGDTAAYVLLLAHRKLTVEGDFARRHDGPTAPRELCGRLHPPLGQPELFVTLPSGKVEKLALEERRGRFCGKVPLRSEGRHTVEVLGRGPRGPEVAALFFVDVGPPPKRPDALVAMEPATPEEARTEILSRINALRAAHGVGPLAQDAQVTAVAQAYSEQMAKENFFAHVAPDGRAVGQRLRAQKVPFKSAGENLGLASGPLAAHFGLEHSPGHRKNLLDPSWTKVGLGLATQTRAEGPPLTVLTQVFIAPYEEDEDPLTAAYEVLDGHRQKRSLPPLQRSPQLEALAREHAKKALAAEEPKPDRVDPRLHERVFAQLDDVKAASVDFFIADSPALIEASKAAGEADNRLVGIGAVKGDSARYGADKYWVVVIYAARR